MLGTPPNLPTTQESLTAHCVVVTKSMPVFEGVLLHFYIIYCSAALEMTHLSCRIIPLFSVNPPGHIQAIGLLCFALTGSHWQMCPWYRHILSIGPISGCECAISLVHKAWFDDEFFIEPLSRLQNSPQEMAFIFWHRLSTCCLPPSSMTNNLAQLYH